MSTCAQKLETHSQRSSSAIRRNACTPAGREVHPLLHFQQAMGNQAVLRLVRGNFRGQSHELFDGKPKAGNKKPDPAKSPSRDVCDNKCGTNAGSFGGTECELDDKTGFPTGKILVEVTDTNPCTRPCVELHEGVHEKKFKSICPVTKKCLDAAGADEKKQDKCIDKHDAAQKAAVFPTECAAYTAEIECLKKREKKAECKTKEGKKRFDQQMKMTKCYKSCFCKG